MTEDHHQQGGAVELRFDPERGVLLASITSSATDSTWDEACLLDRLRGSEWAALRVEEGALARLAADAKLGVALVERVIARRTDASLEIRVSPDGLCAKLDIVAAAGGAAVTKTDVLARLADNGVVHGLRDDAIDAAIRAGRADGVVIAQGRAAEDGEDGWFERLIPEARSRAPKVNESGQTDYRELGDILVVHPGEPLLRCHPPGQGRDGVTVMGTAIAARPGRPLKFAPRLPGTTVSPDDGALLVAEISGQPVEVKGGMIVEPVFAIERVNMASGNLDFDGSIIVRGDVGAGMTVRATGDIEIGGAVEPCVLEAGGNIVVKGGVMGSAGRKDSMAWHARCGGSFHATYAQQARIEAGDSIFIDDTAMQCELSAANHVRVGNRRRGHIIGGHVQAMLSITGKVLGSPSRVATLLEVGVSPALNRRLHELAQQRDGKENQLLDVSKVIAFAEQHPGKVPPEMLARARQTAAALSAEIGALRDEEGHLGQIVTLASDARVVAEQALFEGVVVQLGTQRFRVSGQHGGATIGMGPAGLGILAREDAT